VRLFPHRTGRHQRCSGSQAGSALSQAAPRARRAAARYRVRLGRPRSLCRRALRSGALGITLSERQAELANARIRAEGLEENCRVEVRDYREFPRGTEFDKVVSVGMFEHVGRSRLPTYFHEAARLTKPGGLFLNHGIVRSLGTGPMLQYLTRRALWREGAFVSRYVFPDGELVPLDFALHCAEK